MTDRGGGFEALLGEFSIRMTCRAAKIGRKSRVISIFSIMRGDSHLRLQRESFLKQIDLEQLAIVAVCQGKKF